ncbi:MAG: Crp/Fnr family transcriptional regulator [Chloroflexi bacterium]|nr:MAG: Crp/Fnr family transcriptional regulator [Chloroflexota bacterium]
MGMDLARHKSLLSEAQARVRQTGFLRRLPPALQEQVLEGARLVEYPAGGSMIYRDERRRPALLAWGLLRSYLTWRDDRQLTLVYHRPGDLLEVLRVRGELVSEGLRAIEPSGMLQLDLAAMERLARARRLGLAYSALARQTFGTVRQRVAADLLERAAAGTESLRTGHELKVSAQQLADATGSVREVVGRVLRQLRLSGVLGTEARRLVVRDPAGLQREAEAG